MHQNYLRDPVDVQLLPRVKETLEWAKAEGYLLFLFTNQSGIARGYFTHEQAVVCNQRMFALLGPIASAFSGVCIAPETPEQPQIYRKPSPRYILEMIAKHQLDVGTTWMIGNSASDIQAGINAGVRTAMVHALESCPQLPANVWKCRDLADFRARLMTDSSVSR